MENFRLVICVCTCFTAVFAEKTNNYKENPVITEISGNNLFAPDIGKELSESLKRDLTPSPATEILERQTEQLETPPNETPSLEMRRKKLKATTTKKKPSLSKTEDKPGTDKPEGKTKTARCGGGKKGGRGKGKKKWW